VDLLASRQRDQFAELQTAVTEKLTDVIREQVSTLPRWPAVMDEAIRQLHAKTIADIADQQNQARKQSMDASRPLKSAIKNSQIPSDLPLEQQPESFIDEYAQNYATKLAQIEAGAWESLSFPVMTDREDDIAEAELATFDWIFEKPRSEERPWSSFQEWLFSGDSLYWINGKAGSGKSTLMKHLFNHGRCHEALTAWAGDTPLVTASFFFWYNGSDLQKSQIGLLRALLYQCLIDHRELIPMVLADTARIQMTELSQHWSLPRLKSAFIRLLGQKKIPLKICLFIDGLDEYEGDHSEIAELFKSVVGSEQVKVCVSSRPLLVFDRALKSFPGLMLQNLTYDDIKAYVRNRLSTHERMKELECEEPELAPRLTSDIISKASGVFLWVKLVVYSLLEGLGNYDRGADLVRRLEELPEDLEDLYWHMLDRVKPAWYLEEGFRLLLIVKSALQPLNVLQLCFADMQDPQLAFKSKQNEISAEMQLRQCDGMVGRVKSRCLGLIEIIGPSHTDPCSRRVQFLHKSASDFLDTPKAQSRISECLGGKDFVPELQLMRSTLLELKTVETRLSEHDFHDGGGLKREAWFDDVMPIVVDFMHYAGWAEEKMNTAQIALVDEVDRVTSALWESIGFRSDAERVGVDHWYIAPRKPGATRIEDPDPVRQQLLVKQQQEALKAIEPPSPDGDIGDYDPPPPESVSPSADVFSIDTQKEWARSNLQVHFDVSIPHRSPTREHTRSQRTRQRFLAQSGQRPTRLSRLRSEVPNYASNSSCAFEAFARQYRLDLYVRGKYGSYPGEPSPQGRRKRDQGGHDLKIGGTRCAVLEGRPERQENRRKSFLRFFRFLPSLHSRSSHGSRD
jgi:chromatin segregation and condensation protein Rec8/ScpA/Scc1 (kleisin family)